jgi:hypothetical protein
MLTSGIFQVKLLKKNLDLGIVVSCKIRLFSRDLQISI